MCEPKKPKKNLSALRKELYLAKQNTYKQQQQKIHALGGIRTQKYEWK